MDSGSTNYMVETFVGKQNGLVTNFRWQMRPLPGAMHPAHFENIGKVRGESGAKGDNQFGETVIDKVNFLVTGVAP